MSERVDYRQFVAFLKNNIRLKATTNLFMVTDDHHSVWIALRNGVIESLFFGPRKGMDALNRIPQISGGTLKQDPGLEFPDTPGLPPTDVIIRQLEQGHSTQASAQPSGAPMDSKGEAADGSPAIAPDKLEHIITGIQQLLQQYLGPISTIVVNRLQKRYGVIGTEARLHQFIDELTTEVEGIGDHETFRDQAKQLIGS